MPTTAPRCLNCCEGWGACHFDACHVQQTTIEPLIKTTIAAGTQIYTNEYAIYNPLPEWSYTHKTVCHCRGKYTRHEDGDGFCKVHVNRIYQHNGSIRDGSCVPSGDRIGVSLKKSCRCT
ncbi:transposase [Coleofasciculus sp. FACHB-1120]|nr:transposase [Coleofasciculus sp. FACHB-1120]